MPHTGHQRLIRTCLRGDPVACRTLYDMHKAALFRLCLRYAGSRAEAEDMLQEGFVNIFRDLQQYRGEGPLAAWMRQVMLRAVLMYLRQARRHEVCPPAASAPVPADLGAALDAEYILRCVQELPPGYRAVFNLYAIEGYTHHEIAAMLDISEATSRTQLLRARRLLRKRLEGIPLPENYLTGSAS